MKRLVVTADDFGAAVAVNAAVEHAHRDGILTAASLMVSGAAADDAVERARRLPTLGVGLHLVLVDGVPALPPDRVPDLVGEDGRFRDDMAVVGVDIALYPAVRRQLRAEIAAQFDAFAATGLPLDHVNGHKHFHVHPVITGIVLDLARRHGARAIRAPVEPGRPSGSGWLAAPAARLLRYRARAAGFAVPDRVFGLRASGRVDRHQATRAIAAAGDGLNELYLHPATEDDWAGHAAGYRYRDEYAALLDHGVHDAVETAGVALGSFTGFAAGAT